MGEKVGLPVDAITTLALLLNADIISLISVCVDSHSGSYQAYCHLSLYLTGGGDVVEFRAG